MNATESDPLPMLRRDIEVMPSPVPEQPGLLLRDPFRYTDDILVVPPFWIVVLQCLDGRHTTLDAQSAITRAAGGVIIESTEITRFVSILSDTGYLETEAFVERKKHRHEEFRATPRREASHAGSAYPSSAEAIASEFGRRIPEPRATPERMPLAVAAPHISPEGGYRSYAAAYDLPAPDSGEPPTFVILGTSHYGVPERFGTTAKAFETPLGDAAVDQEALSSFVSRAGDAVVEEDYCHRSEHSIELQVLFLQYRLQRPFRILPILCGPFLESLLTGKRPEETETNRRAFDALSELHATRDDLTWVMGVDMAHMGARYGDEQSVRADEGRMLDVRERDHRRIERMCDGDAEGFFELVHPDGDELKWCGYSPIYTFLRAVGSVVPLGGQLRQYEQWNIDGDSVVSFAALHFFERRDA